MDRCSLTLIPYGKPRISVQLISVENQQSHNECVTEQSDLQNSIYSDLSYEFQIENIDCSQIDNVCIFINDCYESCSYSNGKIRFPGQGRSDRRIFIDCYGFVEITLSIKLKDGNEVNLRSEYLSVLVKKGQLNDSVKAMAQYVYANQEDLLLNGKPKPRDIASLKDQGYKSLMAQVILVEQLLSVYEQNYGYFRANSRFRIDKVNSVDHIEKLQYVSLATMQYIVQHPEELCQVNSNVGVKINNKVYHPNKTLITEDVRLHDIYENRVVVGFIRTLISGVDTLVENTKNLISKIPSEDAGTGEYVHSSLFIFSHTAKMLRECLARLLAVKKKLSLLWHSYNSILNVKTMEVCHIPRPTAIFMAVPQYNRIFVAISQWFTYGIYNLEKENFMLSFIKISDLYESYVLIKLIKHFRKHGYTLENTKKCCYPLLPRWKYKNTECQNTFVFSDIQRRVTLYYQPVIYDSDSREVNGLGLYRNNTISLTYDDSDECRRRYYVPDYVIKVENDGSERYLILDAKFSSLSTVRNNYVSDLSFKYLFSISTVLGNKPADGLCIIYGQCFDGDHLKSVYNRQISVGAISPFAETLPFMELLNSDDQKYELQKLLSKLGL